MVVGGPKIDTKAQRERVSARVRRGRSRNARLGKGSDERARISIYSKAGMSRDSRCSGEVTGGSSDGHGGRIREKRGEKGWKGRWWMEGGRAEGKEKEVQLEFGRRIDWKSHKPEACRNIFSRVDF